MRHLLITVIAGASMMAAEFNEAPIAHARKSPLHPLKRLGDAPTWFAIRLSSIGLRSPDLPMQTPAGEKAARIDGNSPATVSKAADDAAPRAQAPAGSFHWLSPGEP